MKKENIKKYVKNLMPPFIMSFTIAFMLFIYEPITTYASNFEDYWFDFKTLLLNNLVFFAILLVVLLLISNIIYFISKKTKKNIIYNVYVITMFVCFISTYIQGNYLAGALPTLDGTPIVWNDYTTQGIISLILWIFIISLNIILYKKFETNYNKIAAFISIAIFAMLFVSCLSTLLTNNQIYIQKGYYISTTENINNLSTNNNFLVLLTDMEDSKTFDKTLRENNKESLLSDFTYFPDTLSTYPFTRESIPYILSGKWYEAEIPYIEYYTKAMNTSPLIKNLKDNNYDINIYETELNWADSKSLEISNIKAINFEVDNRIFFKQEAKYILFKYLPFPLKKYSKIETLDYSFCRKETLNSTNIFSSDNKEVFDVLDTASLQEKNYFQFVHIDGGHYPWDMNKDFEKIENGTYEEKIESSITVIEKYLNRIKESGQYDNSIIIVLADHGNNGYDPIGRQNPILYIKGLNEHHNEMVVSDKKVSYEDLNNSIYSDLLEGKKATELLPDITNNRVRRFIWYKDYDKMQEQTLDGHAWETEKLMPTGVKYER